MGFDLSPLEGLGDYSGHLGEVAAIMSSSRNCPAAAAEAARAVLSEIASWRAGPPVEVSEIELDGAVRTLCSFIRHMEAKADERAASKAPRWVSTVIPVNDGDLADLLAGDALLALPGPRGAVLRVVQMDDGITARAVKAGEVLVWAPEDGLDLSFSQVKATVQQVREGDRVILSRSPNGWNGIDMSWVLSPVAVEPGHMTVWLVSARVGDQVPGGTGVSEWDGAVLADADVRQWMAAQGFTPENPDECMYVTREPVSGRACLQLAISKQDANALAAAAGD